MQYRDLSAFGLANCLDSLRNWFHHVFPVLRMQFKPFAGIAQIHKIAGMLISTFYSLFQHVPIYFPYRDQVIFQVKF